MGVYKPTFTSRLGAPHWNYFTCTIPAETMQQTIETQKTANKSGGYFTEKQPVIYLDKGFAYNIIIIIIIIMFISFIILITIS